MKSYLANVPTLSPETLAIFRKRKVGKSQRRTASRELKHVLRLVRKARRKRRGGEHVDARPMVIPLAIGQRVEKEARQAAMERQRRAA